MLFNRVSFYQYLAPGWFDALITNDDNCCATIDDLEARVPGLSEGKWYQFRHNIHIFFTINGHVLLEKLLL